MLKNSKKANVIRFNDEPTDIDMVTAWDDFERKCKSKGLSTETVKSYKKHYNKFVSWYDGALTDISDDTVIEYIEYLQGLDLKPVSINTCLRHMKAIFKYWTKNEYMQEVEIEFVKVTEDIKEIYTDDEIIALMKKPKRKNFPEYRTWAIVCFLIGTGCRLRTLVNIKIDDIDFKENVIRMQGDIMKSGKAITVPLGDSLARILREYMSVWTPMKDRYLFPNLKAERLTTTSVGHDVAKYNRSRGVDKTSCHLFRHTFAINYVKKEGDLFALKDLLGHKSITTTQIYAKYGRDLSVNYNKLNVLERLSSNKITIK